MNTVQRQFTPKGERAGFSLIELAVSLALFGVVMSIAAVVNSTGRSAFVETSSGSAAEATLSAALDRVAVELMTASSGTLDPDLTGVVTDTSTISFQQVVGVAGGFPVFGTLTTIRFERDIGEALDGQDNNGNGLVDEGHLVMIRDVGGANQTRVVLCRDVRRHLEGEEAGGGDDNGNGLTDELGFLVEREGDVLTIQLTVEEITPEERLLTRTAGTSMRLRN